MADLKLPGPEPSQILEGHEGAVLALYHGGTALACARTELILQERAFVQFSEAFLIVYLPGHGPRTVSTL